MSQLSKHSNTSKITPASFQQTSTPTLTTTKAGKVEKFILDQDCTLIAVPPQITQKSVGGATMSNYRENSKALITEMCMPKAYWHWLIHHTTMVYN